MNRTFVQLAATVCGVLCMVPLYAAAQINAARVTSTVDEVNARIELKRQQIASTTATMRSEIEKRTTAAMRLATSSSNMAERIANAKERAQAEIDRRITGLQKLIDRIAAMKRVSESFKGDLRATIDAEIANMEVLAARIADGTSTSTLKEDIQSISRSYRIFALVMPQATIAAAAERVVTMTAAMGEIGVKLQTRIEAASASGADVAELNDYLRSLSIHIDAANAYAQTAVEGTANLEPDNADNAVFEANKAALKSAREDLAAAQKELQEGRKDIQAVIEALKALALSHNDSDKEESM